MELTNNTIVLFLISVYFIKTLTIDANIAVNMAIMSVVVYYYYNEHTTDTSRKEHIQKTISKKIDIHQTEPILNYLDKFKLFSEEYSIISDANLKKIILYTERIFIEKSHFYRVELENLLDQIVYHINDEDLKTQFNSIRDELKKEMDKKIVIDQPLSFHQFNGNYNVFS